MARHKYGTPPPGISEILGTYDINVNTGRSSFPISVGSTYMSLRARSSSRGGFPPIESIYPIASRVAEYAQQPLRANREYVAKRMMSIPGCVVAYPGISADAVLAFAMMRKARTSTGRSYYVFEQFGVTSNHDVTKQRPDDPGRLSRFLGGAVAALECSIERLSDDAPVYFTESNQDSRTGELFRRLGCITALDAGDWGTGEGVLFARAGHLKQELGKQFPFLSPSPGARV